jgi:hypothetical protein
MVAAPHRCVSKSIAAVRTAGQPRGGVTGSVNSSDRVSQRPSGVSPHCGTEATVAGAVCGSVGRGGARAFEAACLIDRREILWRVRLRALSLSLLPLPLRLLLEVARKQAQRPRAARRPGRRRPHAGPPAARGRFPQRLRGQRSVQRVQAAHLRVWQWLQVPQTMAPSASESRAAGPPRGRRARARRVGAGACACSSRRSRAQARSAAAAAAASRPLPVLGIGTSRPISTG